MNLYKYLYDKTSEAPVISRTPEDTKSHMESEIPPLFSIWSSFFCPPWQTERLEWHQFQCDLQVAVSVADRLRVESEQALGLLQESHRAVEEQLAQALSSQQRKDRELESLRVEHGDVCRKLAELTLQQQQERAELDALRNARQAKDETERDQQADRRDSEEGKQEEIQEAVQEKPKEAEAKSFEKQKEENETNAAVDAKDVAHDPEEANGPESIQLTGKGVAEGYLRSLAALEKKKERGQVQRDPRKIVMLSERSWWVCMNSHVTFTPIKSTALENMRKCLSGVSLVSRSQLTPPVKMGPQKTQAQRCRYAR